MLSRRSDQSGRGICHIPKIAKPRGAYSGTSLHGWTGSKIRRVREHRMQTGKANGGVSTWLEKYEKEQKHGVNGENQ